MSDIDYQLRQALDNEQAIDVTMVRDSHVMALPRDVKRRCLQISEHLQRAGIDDDPLLRLKRQAKLSATATQGKGKYRKGIRHDQHNWYNRHWQKTEGGYASFDRDGTPIL